MGVALVAAFATGCGPDIAAMCEAREACFGGNEADLDACIVSYEAFRDVAYDIGCVEEFDMSFACREPLLACSTLDGGITCTSNADCSRQDVCSEGTCKRNSFDLPDSNRDACKAEQDAYQSCIR
ncbi:hypothetical protein [Polyangium fumosum]|uniref:Uncharacterized protein n=1 Tax=Polyangium fumosum TaxID=889272 RepID=A0A4U1IP94_9BACT|nr:hypothetical protein [Polyangium fumosum]TKC95872.1 hypothetical protein E8A74_46085 [Polyangium fumosum]